MDKDKFKDVRIIDVMLTQKCNKRCTYCYEQHDKTFGEFSVEKIKKVWDFLRDNSMSEEKHMQFFGGEPLLEKTLILDFLKEHKDELAEHDDMFISLITNALLLTKEFINEYSSYKNTGIMISLDTHIPDPGLRDTTEANVNFILNMAEYCEYKGLPVTMRATISQETVDSLGDYIEILQDRGVKQMVIHPLTLSAKEGFIDWKEEKWNTLQKTIKEKLAKYKDFMIHFSEGVGKVGDASNCMIGSTMIAVDGEGDYSGCYFFTNQKEALGETTTLGNIFTGEMDHDKYERFSKEFRDHTSTDPKCRTCDLKGYCYQCPAGNLSSTDGPKFRADSMCQKIVGLFLTLNRDETAKKLRYKVDLIRQELEEKGDPFVSELLFQLAHKINTGQYFSPTELKDKRLPHYEKVITAYFINKRKDFSIDKLWEVEHMEATPLGHFLDTLGLPSKKEIVKKDLPEYLAYINLVINTRGL